MIARGDLAVEVGFQRLAELQEEILWLTEAAYTPVVWATQVLDNFVRKGKLSRAEMSDVVLVELTRFCGARAAVAQGAHDAEEQTAV
jgi:pyruvate kinase